MAGKERLAERVNEKGSANGASIYTSVVPGRELNIYSNQASNIDLLV